VVTTLLHLLAAAGIVFAINLLPAFTSPPPPPRRRPSTAS
jgi:hypothetical protein